ncbi:hypothetical protein [Nostoc sp.]|uniref:hypothetical protein n=1 Tax=Nostoc sp. TaxID=1180 RepID=UPI002FFA0221
MKDSCNPKRIAIEKMEKFTFYKDAAGKTFFKRTVTRTKHIQKYEWQLLPIITSVVT